MKTINIKIKVPSWAKYITMDRSGQIYIHSCKPDINKVEEWWDSGGKLESLTDSLRSLRISRFNNWQKSIRKI